MKKLQANVYAQNNWLHKSTWSSLISEANEINAVKDNFTRQFFNIHKFSFSCQIVYYISSRSATIIQTYNRHILCFLLEAPQAFRFIGDKETRARPTSQCFDSSDFIGYLKGRSEMTPYGKLLVVMTNGFTYLIQIKLGNWGKLLSLDKTDFKQILFFYIKY